MKTKFLLWLQEKLVVNSKTPWACFETTGLINGRIEFSMRWNKSFIKNLNAQGYQGITEEETVQNFFLASQMIPENMMGNEDTVNPSANPNLTNEANQFRV